MEMIVCDGGGGVGGGVWGLGCTGGTCGGSMR